MTPKSLIISPFVVAVLFAKCNCLLVSATIKSSCAGGNIKRNISRRDLASPTFPPLPMSSPCTVVRTTQSWSRIDPFTSALSNSSLSYHSVPCWLQMRMSRFCSNGIRWWWSSKSWFGTIGGMSSLTTGTSPFTLFTTSFTISLTASFGVSMFKFRMLSWSLSGSGWWWSSACICATGTGATICSSGGGTAPTIVPLSGTCTFGTIYFLTDIRTVLVLLEAPYVNIAVTKAFL